jgi:hypothetical protein
VEGHVAVWALFGSATLAFVVVHGVTPDLLLLGLLLIVCALFVDGTRPLLLGVACGLSYLAQAVMFPLSLALLAAMAVWGRSRRERAWLPAVAGFLMIAVPWIAFLSAERGRATFSDIPWLDHCLVNGGCRNFEPAFEHTEAGLVMFRSAHSEATFPPWYDIAEKRGGTTVVFSPARQWKATRTAAIHTLEILKSTWMLPFAFVSLAALVFEWPLFTTFLARFWPVCAIAVVGVGGYLTRHVEERFLGPLMIPLTLPVLCVIGQRPRKWLALAALVAAIAMLLQPAATFVLRTRQGGYPPDVVVAADAARRAGLTAGDRIVLVGDGIHVYWPRLLKVRIVGEVGDTRTSPATECGLVKEGVKAIVTGFVEPADDETWIEIQPRVSWAKFVHCAAL